jgi:hypothetical protein
MVDAVAKHKWLLAIANEDILMNPKEDEERETAKYPHHRNGC